MEITGTSQTARPGTRSTFGARSSTDASRVYPASMSLGNPHDTLPRMQQLANADSSSESYSVTFMEFRDRPTFDRIIGTILDGFIKHGNVEYGALADTTRDNWETDEAKLLMTMCDQLKVMARMVGEDEESRRALRCVGFLTAGELFHDTLRFVQC